MLSVFYMFVTAVKILVVSQEIENHFKGIPAEKKLSIYGRDAVTNIGTDRFTLYIYFIILFIYTLTHTRYIVLK